MRRMRNEHAMPHLKTPPNICLYGLRKTTSLERANLRELLKTKQARYLHDTDVRSAYPFPRFGIRGFLNPCPSEHSYHEALVREATLRFFIQRFF